MRGAVPKPISGLSGSSPPVDPESSKSGSDLYRLISKHSSWQFSKVNNGDLSTKCYNGHLCQKEKCTGAKPCKIRRSLHDIKLEVSHWEFPNNRDEEEGHGSLIDSGLEDSVPPIAL